MHALHRIVSGGQTGVDRAALDVAIERGLACGGWCPAGRWAEDGTISTHYPLQETESADPSERTRLNVRDSDATLVIAPPPLTGGTKLAVETAHAMHRPVLPVDPAATDAAEQVDAWLKHHSPRILNVAGPRESESPGIGNAAAAILRAVFDGEN